ncbi:MAG: alpha/beta fold hydrolase [Actinomycetota bacterium]|nr:alpha/beta fold hydrolase [Actinomycetota bacterium]
MADGARSGVEAFLDGTLSVRGNLALALELDGLLEHPAPGLRGPAGSDDRPDRFTRAGNTVAAGVRTFHLEAGSADAPPVVCLHGLGATNASLLPIFWDLAADHRVLAPDLPATAPAGRRESTTTLPSSPAGSTSGWNGWASTRQWSSATASGGLYLDDAFGQSGFWTRLPDLDTPALFIWGDRDRLVPAGFARHVIDAVPRSVSVTFEDCGHVPQFEMPERTSQTIRSFLAGLGPRLVH